MSREDKTGGGDYSVDYVHEDQKERIKVINVNSVILDKVVPLREALESANIPNIGTIADICTRKATAETKDPKIALEISYISMYTFDFGDPDKRNNNPCFKINQALFIGTIDSLYPVRHLIWGILKGLRSLPQDCFDMSYRGLNTKIDWEKNKSRLWTGFTLSSVSKTSAYKFMGSDKDGNVCGSLICITNGWGYDVGKYSLTGNGTEVLLEPDARVVVKEIRGGGFVICDVHYIGWNGDLMTESLPPKSCFEETVENGEKYKEGLKMIQDGELNKGFEKMKELSERGYLRGRIKYGELLTDVGRTNEEQREGYSILLDTEKFCDGEGLYLLGRCYEMGIGVSVNESEASRLYLMSFLNGHIISFLKNDVIQKHPEIYKNKDIKAMFREVMIRGEGGDGLNEALLGACLMNGYVIEKNVDEGMRFLKLSCEQGNSHGQFFLGYYYRAVSARLFGLSSGQGNATVQQAIRDSSLVDVGHDGEADKLKQSLDQSKKELDKLRTEIGELKQSLEKKESEVSELQKGNESLKQTLEKKESEMSELQKESESLKQTSDQSNE